MGEKNSSKVLSEKELEEVLGGANKGGNSVSYIIDNRTCPNCGVTGPHTAYSGGRIVCDNCNKSSKA